MYKATVLAAFAAVAAARKCHDMMVPISIEAENSVFDLEPPTSEIDVTNFFLHLSRPGTSYPTEIMTGKKTIQGSYKIAATYCEPSTGPGSTLQILTHGVGFDRSYWDLPVHDGNYSYVDRALEQGYSTFSYDRLGIGASSKGDAVNEIQLFLEVAALRELTTRLADGNVCGVNAKFDKTVHMGHSFGSVITFALSSMFPDSTNAIVLTGFSLAMSYMAFFALGGNFAPTGEIDGLKTKYPAGYVAPKNSIGVHINFFAPNDFDPELLQYATANGQPAAVGELLSIGGASGMPSNFEGAVLVITGEHDVPFCGGNCLNAPDSSAPNLIAATKSAFPKASSFNATVVPGAGHGLNFGYSHTFTYDHILEFIQSAQY